MQQHDIIIIFSFKGTRATLYYGQHGMKTNKKQIVYIHILKLLPTPSKQRFQQRQESEQARQRFPLHMTHALAAYTGVLEQCVTPSPYIYLSVYAFILILTRGFSVVFFQTR